MKKTPASIMMVTYNRLDLTKKTLECVFENTDYPYNLIIVDNNSKDKTIEYITDICNKEKNKNYFEEFILISNLENKGIAIGRNQALHLAKDEWLCTIDNDVWLPKNWLSQCIETITENPKIGIVGVNMEDDDYPICDGWKEKLRGNLGTACMVFHRSLHKMIGFFDISMGTYAHEDADFCFRTKLVGLKIGYIKENGKHLGQGENDIGSYREYKDKQVKENLPKFNKNCHNYISGKKPIYIKFP